MSPGFGRPDLEADLQTLSSKGSKVFLFKKKCQDRKDLEMGKTGSYYL